MSRSLSCLHRRPRATARPRPLIPTPAAGRSPFSMSSLLTCIWLTIVIAVMLVHGQVQGQTQAPVPVDPVTGIPLSVLADLYSSPPGAWLVSDQSSTLLRNKSSVINIGLIVSLSGGPKGYLIPKNTPIGASGASVWCLAAGTVVAMMDVNADPSLLPDHRVQLVMAHDSGDPVKAFSQAQDVYSLPRQDTSVNVTQPVSLVLGGLSVEISRSVAAVAKHFNRPFMGQYTDSSLLPPSVYPTLVSASVSYDVIASAVAQFAANQGWARVATFTSLANDAVADAGHFSKAAASLGITVAIRETFDESQAPSPPATDGSWPNPSLDAAIARLRLSNVRIIFLGCTQTLSYAILTALDRAGMVGPSYVYLGGSCLNTLSYATTQGKAIPLSRKAHLLSGVIPVQTNTFLPQNPKRVADFYAHLVKRSQDTPEALFYCDPQIPVYATIMTVGYEKAITAMHGLHMLQQQKQLCQQPSNQQKLEQALPIQQVQQMGPNFDCRTAMGQSPWNTSLAIDCCRLDPVRSPYIRPPSPFGDESYVNGDGPVLLDMLRSVRVDGITGPIGIQTPESPIANVLISNYFVDPDTGIVKVIPRQIYKTSSCNVSSNLCTWDITRISPFTYGDGITDTPDDGVIRYVATLNPSSIGRGIFVAVSVLGMVVIGVVSVLMWRYRVLKSIKSSSITFVMLILFAAVSVLSTVIMLYHDDSVASCQARVWMGHLSFAVLFGSLLLKTYRLAHIFDNRALRVKAKSDLDLLKLLSIYVTVVCALLISWMVRHAPTVVFKLRSDGRAGYYTCESDSYTEMWALLGVHGAGLAWGIYLCVKSQDVFAELNESKQIAMSIYNVAMLSALIVAIDQGLNYYHVDITFYIYASGILLGAVTTVALLTTPKIINIYTLYTANKTGHVHRQRTKSDELASGAGYGCGPKADLNSGGEEKRSSLGRSDAGTTAGTLDSLRVPTSGLGLGMTPADWMKLNVFTRKCYEATNNNNIGRLIMEQNKVYALLSQIYKDATQGNRDQPATATAAATATTATACTTSSPTPLKFSHPITVSNLAAFPRHRYPGSISSDVGPYDVNENGVRFSMTGAVELQELFLMQANQAPQQRPQAYQHINKPKSKHDIPGINLSASASASGVESPAGSNRASIIDTAHVPVHINDHSMNPSGTSPEGQPRAPSCLVESASSSEQTSLCALTPGGHGHERLRSSSIMESQHELEPVELNDSSALGRI